MNKIYNEDCLQTIGKMEDKSIDLVVTSPPYEDIKSYGKKVKNRKENEWVDWLTNIFVSLKPKLKDTASLVINVNSGTYKKERSLAPQKLMISLSEHYHHFDEYIWAKRNGIPSGSRARINNMHEYILHFTVTDSPKMDTSRVLEAKAEGSKLRQKYRVHYQTDGVTDDGIVKRLDESKKVTGDMRIPFSYLYFCNTSALKGKPQSHHPAPFHPGMPSFFIKMLTDEGDTVYDTFMGSGTTAYSAIVNNRNWIGSELNPAYIPLIEENVRIAEEEAGTQMRELFV